MNRAQVSAVLRVTEFRREIVARKRQQHRHARLLRGVLRLFSLKPGLPSFLLVQYTKAGKKTK
jgi:hypothetical protein